MKVGDKIKITDSKLPTFGNIYYILFKTPHAEDLWSFGEKATDGFAVGYAGSSQFEVIKRISFDFDGTLSFIHQEGYECMKHIQEIAKQLTSEDKHDIYIITRRNFFDFEETFEVFNLAALLGINKNKIIFTNREYKFHTINQLEVDIHIDDDWEDLDRIAKHTKCKTVWSLDREVEQKFVNLINEIKPIS
jgi:hydroxymethylpyrimidine pyrophosphatase-like HAD family hydrolase